MVNKCVVNGDTVDGIIYGTFHYRSQMGASGAFRLGGVFGSYIEFDRFKPNTISVSIGDVLKYYQTFDTDETFNPVTPPRDVFINDYIVKEITEKNGKTHIVAYDSTTKLDVDFSKRLKELEPSFPMKLRELVSEAATVAGVATGMSTDQLSLGWVRNVEIGYFFVDGITVRDIFSYAAEMYGRIGKSKSINGINTDGFFMKFGLNPGEVGTQSYIIAPDDADYSSGSSWNYNVWYKENCFEYKQVPTQYDGVRVISTSGQILGQYDNVSPPTKLYYVTGNTLIDNISSLIGYTYNDYAQFYYNRLNSVFYNLYSGFNPTKVTIFPFRMPYEIGEVVTAIDTTGTKIHFPIMSIDLTASGLVLQGYGAEDEDYGYGSSYYTAEQNQTLLESEINSLFKSVDNIVTNMPTPSDSTPENLGTADPGVSDEYSRSDHVHDLPTAADVGAVPASDVQYKIYDSVTDIGLTDGSATISDAWNALPDYSILICNAAEFASGECPNAAGTVEICRLVDSPNARGWLYFRARRPVVDDYRMFLGTGDPASPTGTWIPDGPYATEYLAGTYTETSGTGYGLITSSGRNMYFYAFLPKFFHLASTVKVTALTATVRIPGGGYVPSASFNFTSELNSANATIYGSHIGFHADRSTGWGQPNNSTTMFIIESITFTVT